MNFNYIKNKEKYFSKALLLLSLLLIALLVFKVAAFGIGSILLPDKINTAVTASTEKAQGDEEDKTKNNEAVEKLKQKNMFTPPAPKPVPPACSGVLGDEVIINGKGYKVGQEVGGAKIVAITPNEVTILWEEKEMKLPVFGAVRSNGPPPPSPQAGPGKKPERTGPVPQRMGPGRGGGGFENMSMEKIKAMQEKVMQMSPEEREKFVAEQRAKMNR